MTRYTMEWNDDQVNELMALFRRGMTSGEIAERIGVSRNTVGGTVFRLKRDLGLSTPEGRVTHKRRSSPTDHHRSKTMLTLPQSAGFVSSYVYPPPRKPDEGQLASIVDVSGCKWPVRDDPEFVGGQAFCNHGTNGATYCPFHKQASVASYSRSLIRQTTRAAIHVSKRAS